MKYTATPARMLSNATIGKVRIMPKKSITPRARTSPELSDPYPVMQAGLGSIKKRK